eukprot:g2189.t1
MLNSLYQSIRFLFALTLATQVCGRDRLRNSELDKNTTYVSDAPEAFDLVLELGEPADSPDLDELDITFAMQFSILSASVDNVAWLLLDFDDIRPLGLGFRFPRHRRDEYLKVTNDRDMDPDVVAIRGLATAALSLVNATKLADVFLISIYGLDFYDNVCTPDVPIERDIYGIANCHEVENFDGLRRNLTESFNDQDLMQLILDTEPEAVNFGKKNRALMVASGRRVDSFNCAYCFESSFCNKHVFWCPSNQNKRG